MKIRRKDLVDKNIDRTVHFIPLRNEYEWGRRFVSLENVLNHRAFRLLDSFKKDQLVGIKPCVNDVRLSVDYILSIAMSLRQNDVMPFICDTSDRYRNKKTNGVKHSFSAFVQEPRYNEMSLPYIMADGILANHEINSKTHRSIPADVYLAGELSSMNGLISVCAPVPSSLAGLSGAIVNVGMGLASKRGKIFQNTISPPKVNVEKCYLCRKCVRVCPTKAIYVDVGHVGIDGSKCINCGLCTEVAQFGGITYDWDATPEHFQKSVVNHANAASRILNKSILYVNIFNYGSGYEDSFIDCGILVSRNPVAIDAAIADMYINMGKLSDDEYENSQSLVSKGVDAGLGARDYILDNIAY